MDISADANVGMDRLLSVAETVAEDVFSGYGERGGKVLVDGRELSLAELASFRGALTPLFWMLREFITDYEIPFPPLEYVADAESLTQVSLKSLAITGSASPTIFMLSDFLRNEIVPDPIHSLDLSTLFANFREWAYVNVQGVAELAQQNTATPT